MKKKSGSKVGRADRKGPMTLQEIGRVRSEVEELAGELEALVKELERYEIQTVEIDGVNLADRSVDTMRIFISKTKLGIARARSSRR